MTYKELLSKLQQLNEEQLSRDVYVCDTKYDCGDSEAEYYDGVEFVFATEECDVLDENYPIIRF